MGGDGQELAPGTGIWTERLLRSTRPVTTVVASPEMVVNETGTRSSTGRVSAAAETGNPSPAGS